MVGAADYSGGARVGATACEATEWTSESAARCRAGQGVGATWTMGMTVAKQAGSLTEAVSFDTMSTEPSWYFNVGMMTASMTVTGSGRRTTAGWLDGMRGDASSTVGVAGSMGVSMTVGGSRLGRIRDDAARERAEWNNDDTGWWAAWDVRLQ